MAASNPPSGQGAEGAPVPGTEGAPAQAGSTPAPPPRELGRPGAAPETVRTTPDAPGGVPYREPAQAPWPADQHQQRPQEPSEPPREREASPREREASQEPLGFAEVRFKGARKGYYAFRGLELADGVHVTVEAEGGFDLGRVSALGAVAERKCSSSGGCATPTPELEVLRIATGDEVATLAGLRADEENVRRRARQMASQRGLAMKFFDAEWRFDRRYLILHFTAPKRVDFRSFLPELARTFRARVRLEHVTPREEARQLGGIGRCGRELCCSTWMPTFRKVTVSAARDQGLSLNPEQISGCCGRLMCCLLHEHSAYVEARRRFPREGRVLKLANGPEEVVKVDIPRESVWLRSSEGERRCVTLVQLEEELTGDASPEPRHVPERSRPQGVSERVGESIGPTGEGRTEGISEEYGVSEEYGSQNGKGSRQQGNWSRRRG